MCERERSVWVTAVVAGLGLLVGLSRPHCSSSGRAGFFTLALSHLQTMLLRRSWKRSSKVNYSMYSVSSFPFPCQNKNNNNNVNRIHELSLAAYAVLCSAKVPSGWENHDDDPPSPLCVSCPKQSAPASIPSVPFIFYMLQYTDRLTFPRREISPSCGESEYYSEEHYDFVTQSNHLVTEPRCDNASHSYVMSKNTAVLSSNRNESHCQRFFLFRVPKQLVEKVHVYCS